MIRLLTTLVLAAVLWPVDEQDRPLGFGGEPLSTESAIEFAQSTFHHVVTFCDERAGLCEAVTETAANVAYKVGDQLNALDFTQTGSVKKDESE